MVDIVLGLSPECVVTDSVEAKLSIFNTCAGPCEVTSNHGLFRPFLVYRLGCFDQTKTLLLAMPRDLESHTSLWCMYTVTCNYNLIAHSDYSNVPPSSTYISCKTPTKWVTFEPSITGPTRIRLRKDLLSLV
jgi:hypothetical protein